MENDIDPKAQTARHQLTPADTRKGGMATTEEKQAAARRNGLKGGRKAGFIRSGADRQKQSKTRMRQKLAKLFADRSP